MANIVAIQIQSQDFVNLETAIQEIKPDFSFVEGTTYQIQIYGPNKFCVKDTEPNYLEGFSCSKPFSYKHISGLNLWVKNNNVLPDTSIIINVGD